MNLSGSPTCLGMSLGARALAELACTADGLNDGEREWLFTTAVEVAEDATDLSKITDSRDLTPYFRGRELLVDAPLQREFFLQGVYPDAEAIRTAANDRNRVIIDIAQSLDEVTRATREYLVGVGAECSVKHLIERGDQDGGRLVVSSHLRQDMIGDVGDSGRIPPWAISVYDRSSWFGDGANRRIQVKHGSPKNASLASAEQPSPSPFDQADSVTTMTLATVATELEDGFVYAATFPRIAKLLSRETETRGSEPMLDTFSQQVRERLYLG